MTIAEKKITVIPGDGIGPEIIDTALTILHAAAVRTGMKCICTKYLAGGAAIDACGFPLPEETVNAARAADAGVLLTNGCADPFSEKTVRASMGAVLRTPPSIDAGEITDKGYVNQRATLTARDDVVKALFADELSDGVIEVEA